MARKYRYCIHCRRVLIESEIQRGEFVNTDFGILCPQCAEKLRAEQPPPPPPPAPPPEKEAGSAKPAEPPAQTQSQPQPQSEPEPPKPARAARPKRSSATPTPKAESSPEAEHPPKTEPVRQPAASAPERGDASPELRRISEQLDQLLRTLLFERSSIWNIMGAVAQCIAAGVFIIALLNWLDGPHQLLQTALLLQVAALTFFVKGK